MTPKPPSPVGRQTTSQATLHLPPVQEAALAQLKARRRLSICLIAQLDRQQAMLKCTGIADSVTFVSRTLPALVRSPDFHVGVLAAMASMSGCSSARPNLRSDNGIPWYLQGKGDTTHENTCWTSAITSSSQRIGVITHLSMLVTRLEAPANNWRIYARHWRSSVLGDNRTTRSSA